MEQNCLLDIKNLTINNKSGIIIDSISFQLMSNEILGIVGESGSGKSISSLTIMGLLPKASLNVTEGAIIFKKKNLIKISERDYQSIRGKQISMIFQEPMSSLNPSMRCGEQVGEILHTHYKMTAEDIKKEVLLLFEKVKLPNPERIYYAYPHEISGGQKQRVMIAIAVACKPEILIADEPTTALDVTVQKEIITLLKELQRETKMSIIFISHDLTLISEIADNIAVMYKGEIVEQRAKKELFIKPKHPYTKALLNARPDFNVRLKKLPTVQDFLEERSSNSSITKEERFEKHEKLYSLPPLLKVNNLQKTYFSNVSRFSKSEGFKAIDNVSFELYEGESLGLVGESGCGKSTLANVILQLDRATHGEVIYKGKNITNLSASETKNLRRELQIIFQDPYGSLNPRIPIGRAILEPMKVHNLYKSDVERKGKVIEILERVGLSKAHYNRYPHEFSGGQRQRVNIARTIALQPKIIICDESVSALDVSVQAQVINLLNELKDKYTFTYIFISHDLAVTKYISDRLIVMNKGKIEVIGETDSIYENPKTDYTKKLIEAIPKVK